ncbi:vWA domain-containing protein [Acidovorax lacteus]
MHTTPMRTSARPLPTRLMAALLAAALVAQPIIPAYAANHPLSAVRDVNTIDYVVNVDWDYDNPPTQAANPSQRLDRNYITEVLRVMARSKFTATEGRHRVGTVYVYKGGRFGDNVDIRMLNSNGRSAANVAGWGKRGTTSYNHLAFQNAPESIDALGKVINHELGHYTYGLLDEYVEEGAPLKPDDPGSPSGVDTPKNTAMNNHLQFVSLSTPADYADPTKRQTAQARVFATAGDGSGGSAWETLTRPAEQDPPAARAYGRTFFEAFRGVDPAALRLQAPTEGFDTQLRVVFAAAPVFRDVIVIDRTLPAARLADLLQAARALVNQAGADAQFAVVASPAAGADPVLGFTTADAEGKQALNAALDGIQPAGEGSFNSLTAFTKAYQLIAGVRQSGDPATVHLLTGSETVLPVETLTTARTARVAVNPLGLSGGGTEARQARTKAALAQSAAGQTVNLAQVAQQTGGAYNVARNGAEAAKDAARALNEVHSNPFAFVRVDGTTALPAGGRFSSQFRVASSAIDGPVEAEAFFDPQDAGKLSFSLVAPDGRVFTPGNAPAGVEFETEPGEGLFTVRIGTGVAARAGTWTIQVSSASAMVDGLGIDVATESRMALNATALGGSVGAATAPVLRATLGADKRIKGARVVATVYDEDGNTVLDNAVLRDDGVAPDVRAGDGEYTLSLDGKLKAGEYYAYVRSVTDSNARVAPLGALIKGARQEEVPVEAFEREVEVAFSLEAGAPGVVTDSAPAPTPTPTPTPPSDGGGGGCTVNPDGRDASLALLLGLGLLGWALRRRRSDTPDA